MARDGAAARAILWDFDGTLAHRPGRWRGCLIETLDEHEPGRVLGADEFVSSLDHGFPWHAPDVAHPELGTPEAWWERVEVVVASAYEGIGLEPARARELARRAHELYVDGRTGWELYEDSRPVLASLRGRGWQHVILSNHVPELEQIVDCLGLDELIDAVVTSAATGYEKPHPEAFAEGRRAAGEPPTIWMVGDNPEADVAGAEAVGIPAVLVRTRQASRRRAETLHDVIPLLESSAS